MLDASDAIRRCGDHGPYDGEVRVEGRDQFGPYLFAMVPGDAGATVHLCKAASGQFSVLARDAAVRLGLALLHAAGVRLGQVAELISPSGPPVAPSSSPQGPPADTA